MPLWGRVLSGFPSLSSIPRTNRRASSIAVFPPPLIFRNRNALRGPLVQNPAERISLKKESARQQIKFAIITGAKDFRYGNLLDIFQGGYGKNGYAAKLIDVPGMKHAICKDKQLGEAISFFEAPLVQKK